MISITCADEGDIDLLHQLAHRIWWQFYPAIIGDEQVAYMLDKFSSKDHIAAQLQSGFSYFLVYDEGEAVGYIGVEDKAPSLFVSKFYLDQSRRGRGIAKQMLAHVNKEAKARGHSQIELTVNKYNPSYEIYLKLGFENVESLVMDIGNGFVMDDYRMIKTIA